jgi:hypothetical protein
MRNPKNSKKPQRGGADDIATPLGGAVPVVSPAKPEMPSPASMGGKPAMAYIPADVQRGAAIQDSNTPMATSMLDLAGNKYIGATAASRAAPVTAPGGLLQGGGSKKRSKTGKKKGGDGSCHPMNAPIPAGTFAGGELRASVVVPGAVGGVKAQEVPASMMVGNSMEMTIGAYEGGDMPNELMGGAKKKDRKGKKQRGGEEYEADGGMNGGAKKKGRKQRGGKEAENGKPPNHIVSPTIGGTDNKKSKKQRGGVEPFNPSAISNADLQGGFDSLLADLKKQVGGRYKSKGGAFSLYARELNALSKKLRKLI